MMDELYQDKLIIAWLKTPVTTVRATDGNNSTQTHKLLAKLSWAVILNGMPDSNAEGSLGSTPVSIIVVCTRVVEL